MATLHHLLRPSISLFLGIICTSSFSLFLLLSIVNNSNISVNSLHHDFQTVYIITTDRWLRNPQFRAAVELRWLWASLGFALAIGLLPKERADRLLGWLVATKLYIRARSASFFLLQNPLQTQRESRQNVASINFERCLSWVSSRVRVPNFELTYHPAPRAAADARAHLYLSGLPFAISTTQGINPRPRTRCSI